jgi:hypothetical protein
MQVDTTFMKNERYPHFQRSAWIYSERCNKGKSAKERTDRQTSMKTEQAWNNFYTDRNKTRSYNTANIDCEPVPSRRNTHIRPLSLSLSLSPHIRLNVTWMQRRNQTALRKDLDKSTPNSQYFTEDS